MREGIFFLLFLIPYNIFSQGLLVLNKNTKEPLPFCIVKCDEKYFESDEEGKINFGTINYCNQLSISSLGYNTLKMELYDLSKLKIVELVPYSYTLNEVKVSSEKINLNKELQYLIARYRKLEHKKEKLRSKEIRFQTKLNREIIENGYIISSKTDDNYTIRDYVKYEFSTEKPYFSLDIDVIVTEIFRNSHKRKPYHLLQLHKTDLKSIKTHLLDSEKISSSEIRTLKYILQNGNEGIIKYNVPNYEIIEHSFTVEKNNFTAYKSINKKQPVTLNKQSFHAFYTNGEPYKLRYLSEGELMNHQETVKTILEIKTINKNFTTIHYPIILSKSSILEDAYLLNYVNTKNQILNQILFDSLEYDNLNFEINHQSALNIVDTLKYLSNKLSVWEKDYLIDSSFYMHFMDYYNPYENDFFVHKAKEKYDIRWIFQKNKNDILWRNSPSIWVKNGAYFIKKNQDISKLLCLVIFDIFQMYNILCCQHLNSNGYTNKEAYQVIKEFYAKALDKSNVFIKALSHSDFHTIQTVLNHISNVLEKEYYLDNFKLTESINGSVDNFSKADLLFVLGENEKAIQEYLQMLTANELKDEIKSNIYYNLSQLYCKINDIKNSKFYFNRFIEFNNDIEEFNNSFYPCE